MFRAPSGELAYTVPAMSGVMSDDFSADDSLLALGGVGDNGETEASLVVVHAATGSVIMDTVVASPVYAVAFDPVRPLFYAVTSTSGQATVDVFDRTTWKLVGLMQAPASTPSCCGPNAVAAVDRNNNLFVYWSDVTTGHAYAWRFSLPSVSGT